MKIYRPRKKQEFPPLTSTFNIYVREVTESFSHTLKYAANEPQMHSVIINNNNKQEESARERALCQLTECF